MNWLLLTCRSCGQENERFDLPRGVTIRHICGHGFQVILP